MREGYTQNLTGTQRKAEIIEDPEREVVREGQRQRKEDIESGMERGRGTVHRETKARRGRDRETDTRAHMYTCVCTHAYTHVHTHTHILMCTHAPHT